MIKIAFLNHYKKKIEMLYVNGLIYYYFLILVGIISDYKEQVLIIGINVNVKYSVCHMTPK